MFFPSNQTAPFWHWYNVVRTSKTLLQCCKTSRVLAGKEHWLPLGTLLEVKNHEKVNLTTTPTHFRLIQDVYPSWITSSMKKLYIFSSFSRQNGKIVFWGLTAPSEVLKETAELYKIKLPIKELEVDDKTWYVLKLIFKLSNIALTFASSCRGYLFYLLRSTTQLYNSNYTWDFPD